MLLQERKIDSIWTGFLNEPFLKYDDILPYHKAKQLRPDIIVIKLKQPFDLNTYVMPASLPTKPIEAGSKCVVSGWGNTKPRKKGEIGPFTKVTPDRLQYAKLEVANNAKCERIYYKNKFCRKDPKTLKKSCIHGPFLKEYEICTTGKNQDVCSGDSGGPLMCEGTQKKTKKNCKCAPQIKSEK